MAGVAASQRTPDRTDMAAPAIACAIAFLAGATEICGLARLHDLFVSFMRGNTTMLAFALGRGDLAPAGMIAGYDATMSAAMLVAANVAEETP
jgi:uncharacterized membrane protein YoaK (UPF0700 family)